MTSPLGADDKIFDKLLSQYPARQIPKGRPILYQGEIPAMAFYVKAGIVKIYNITDQGDEKIVGYEGEGGLLPIEWLFNRSPVSLYYCDTVTDCQVLRIPSAELITILKQNLNAALAMLERSISASIAASIHLHALEQSKARNKLLYIFQYLVLRFGQPVNKTHSKINLRLTHQEIANLIGTTRETTSSEIAKLSKEGVVKVQDLKYIVDNDKALRLVGENDFNELSL